MNGVISARQLMLIVILVRYAALLVSLPIVQAGDARQDAWISVIISTAASVLITVVYAKLAMKFPEESFGQFANRVLGRPLGTASTLLVALSFYVISLARTRMMSLVIISQFMPNTPGWALAIPVLLTAFYGAYLGPDTAGRAAELIFTILTVMFLAGNALVLISGAGPMTSVRPVLTRGIKPVLQAAVPGTFLGCVSGSIVLALGKFTKRTQGLPKAVGIGIAVSGGFLLVVTLNVLTTLGFQQAQNNVTSVLSLASSIYIGGVIERTDLVLLTAWLLGVTFDVTVLLMSASILIGDSFNIHYRTVSIALFLIGVIPVSHRITDIFSLSRINTPAVTGIWTLGVYICVVGLAYVACLVKERTRGKP